MKICGFWVLFLVVGTAFMFLTISSSSSSNAFPDMVFPRSVEVKATATIQKLKENSKNLSIEKKKWGMDNMNLMDYHDIDPVPNSHSAIESGPIEHGNPLMPYIPKPEPPSYPKPGDIP